MTRFDFGMGSKNPIDRVHFYTKDNPDRPIQIRKDEVCSCHIFTAVVH
jgi:hypothetical protein